MLVIILKWLSQLLILLGSGIGLREEVRGHKDSSDRRSRARIVITIATLLIGFLLFAITDIKERKENSHKNEAQARQIATLEQVNQELIKLSMDRSLSGVEFSFTPSAEQWSKIAAVYEKIKSPVPEIPYSAATMRAERIGEHWKIDFDPVSRPEGTIRFRPVSTGQAQNKAFEAVLHEAAIGLWIKWGGEAETEIEPWRDAYPSAITVSQNTIAFTLRPPVIMLSLGDLRTKPTIIFRGRDETDSLRIRSLDSNVILDQTITLNWKKDDDSTDNIYLARTKPYVSGPHQLQISFKSISR